MGSKSSYPPILVFGKRKAQHQDESVHCKIGFIVQRLEKILIET